MGKAILGILLANVAMFVFGAAFWMSPLGQMAVAPAPDDAGAQAAIAQAFPETGAYFVPANMEADNYAELHASGPLALVTVNHISGLEPMSPKVFLSGFLHGLVVVVLLALILRCIAGSYARRLFVCAMVGLLAGVLVNGANYVWWYAPQTYVLLNIVYNALSITVAGILLAAFVKKPD